MQFMQAKGGMHSLAKMSAKNIDFFLLQASLWIGLAQAHVITCVHTLQ